MSVREKKPGAPLITLREVTKAYGERPLLEGITLHVAADEHLGIIGPNGAGKTTLLRLLGGRAEPDSGERLLARPCRIGWVDQTPRFSAGASLEEVVAGAIAADPPSPELRGQGAGLEGGRGGVGWEGGEGERAVRAAVVLGRVGFGDPARPVETLSGGWVKRLAIARALAVEPDLLLLDEPTNHLDLESILWLEELLRGFRGAYAVISHDRAFLQAVAGRVAEVAPRYPGGLFAVQGTYREFLQRREELLVAQQKRRETLGTRVKREVEWLSRGPKARGTKAQGRIQEAARLQAELDELRARAAGGSVELDFAASGRKSKRLLVARDLGVRVEPEGRWLVRGLDLLLRPGLRLGLVGPNGSGKTTLLRTLAGERPPQQGRVRVAEHLQRVYFDQQREQLDPDVTLRRALAPAGDAVIHQGRSVHVVSFARRFGFRQEHLEAPVRRLSGGEQAKVLIARLMLRAADILLLDEPTNDLDIPTLEVLEDALQEFPGSVVMVTHDRYLLDRVADLVLGLDGEGGATLFAGVDQWLEDRAARQRRQRRRRGQEREQERERQGSLGQRRGKGPGRGRRARKALTYGEELELAGIEETITAADRELSELEASLEDPYILSDAAALQERYAAVEAARERSEGLYARWAELEEKREADESL